MVYSFPRYLSAKKSVDDRALNAQVWGAMANWVRKETAQRPLRILEIGAGIGTMIERFADHDLLINTHYTAIDALPENISSAQERLAQRREGAAGNIVLEAIDLYEFMVRERGRNSWDLIIAHAVLDLLDVAATLPLLFELLASNGRYYFTINFDGATILQPPINPLFDAQIEQIYHRTMDERFTDGKPSGDSQAGRHLFSQLRQADASILAAGSSDWVVFANEHGYPVDEAYFLHFIIHTMHNALATHPDLDSTQFAAWIAQRHAQIESGELIYIAHQLDFFGKV